MNKQITYVYVEQTDDEFVPVLSQDQEIEATGWLHALINWAFDAKPLVCASCGHTLLAHDDSLTIQMYKHEYGWHVAKDFPKQWLSCSCNKCGYETSLHKLGIPR